MYWYLASWPTSSTEIKNTGRSHNTDSADFRGGLDPSVNRRYNSVALKWPRPRVVRVVSSLVYHPVTRAYPRVDLRAPSCMWCEQITWLKDSRTVRLLIVMYYYQSQHFETPETAGHGANVFAELCPVSPVTFLPAGMVSKTTGPETPLAIDCSVDRQS